MCIEHLNDEDFQILLESNIVQEGKKEHINNCSICKANYNLYKTLFYNLNESKVDYLSENFTYNVIDTIKTKRNKIERIKYSSFYIFIVLLSSAVTFFYYKFNFLKGILNLQSLGRNRKLVQIFIDSFKPVINLVSKNNQVVFYVLVVILLIFLLNLFDKKLIKKLNI